MRNTFLFLSLSAISAFPHTPLPAQDAGDDPVGKLHSQFEKKLEVLEGPPTELNSNYRQHLEKQKAAYQKEGKLDALLAINEELDTIDSEPAENLSKFPELKRLQQVYRDQLSAHDAEVGKLKLELIRSFRKSADELVGELTKAGRIEEAKLAQANSKRLAEMEKNSSVLVADSPKSDDKVIWELRSSEDYQVHGSAQIVRKADLYEISGPDHHRLSTSRSFTPPFRIQMQAGTKSTNVRLYYGNARHNLFIILNWQQVPTELHFYDPNTGVRTRHPDQDALEPGKLHAIDIAVEAKEIVLTVDGKERLRAKGDFAKIDSTIGIGPGARSTVLLKEFRVYGPKS